MVVSWQEVLLRNTELTSLHQPEEFGKVQKETPSVRPPPRIHLFGIHLGWTRHAPPGRTVSQNDWWWMNDEWMIPAKDNPETNPITIKPCDCKSCGRAVLLASPTLLLSTWVPVPNKISSFVSRCVSLDNSFPSVRQEPSFQPWKGFPFLQHYFQSPFYAAPSLLLHLLCHQTEVG